MIKTVLVAPDKYRGTLTAAQAAAIISGSAGVPCHVIPMADGGEGTADAIAGLMDLNYCSWPGDSAQGFYVSPDGKTAAIDSAAYAGYNSFAPSTAPLERSTRQLGLALRHIITTYNPEHIHLCVGGTATCDFGTGMLEVLDSTPDFKPEAVTALMDVRSSLIPMDGCVHISAFWPQKGFSPEDCKVLEHKIAQILECHTPGIYDGAGGGLGYALASVLKVRCVEGARWMTRHSGVNWARTSAIITGEGRFDTTSLYGKATGALAAEGLRHGIPVYILAGCVQPGIEVPEGATVLDLSTLWPQSTLNTELAVKRLEAATKLIAQKL